MKDIKEKPDKRLNDLLIFIGGVVAGITLVFGNNIQSSKDKVLQDTKSDKFPADNHVD